LLRKYKRGLDWHVVAPDGIHINLNTAQGADEVLGLWETIQTLDAQLRKRRRRRKKADPVDVELLGST